MKFSVLLSVYKKENPDFFRQAIDSILAQTCRPDEIVIVQDGPLTDGLYAACTYYQKKYGKLFHFVPLEQNVGLGRALRAGVEVCQYEIIARMDTDDLAKPERFERQLREFENDSALVLLGSAIEEFSTVPENVDTIRTVPLSAADIAVFAKHRNPFNHMTVMFCKSAVMAVGNYLPMHLSEDYYLWFRLIHAGYKVKNLSDCLVSARVDQNMFQRRGGMRYFLEEMKLQQIFYHEGFINAKEYSQNLFVRLAARIMPNVMRGYLYRKCMRK